MTDLCDWPRVRVPDACRNTDIVVGIDEAGRGPVLGAVFFYNASETNFMICRVIDLLCSFLAEFRKRSHMQTRFRRFESSEGRGARKVKMCICAVYLC
jgi:hypothetical protein